MSYHETARETGLQIMGQILDILHDRETVPDGVLAALSVEDIETLYADYVGPAVDGIEDALS